MWAVLNRTLRVSMLDLTFSVKFGMLLSCQNSRSKTPVANPCQTAEPVIQGNAYNFCMTNSELMWQSYVYDCQFSMHCRILFILADHIL